MNDIIQDYQRRINGNNEERLKFRVFQKYFPISRLIAFIVCLILFYYCVATHSFVFIITLILVFIAFLVLGLLDVRYKAKISKLEILNEINNNEINCIKGNYSKNEAGDEFSDMDHPYTFDLDIFGTKSLFQYINRTSTVFGKHKLAEYFRDTFSYRNDILERREAIKELAGKIDFRQNFLLIFKKESTAKQDLDELNIWLNQSPVKAAKLTLLTVFLYVMNVITITSIILFFAGIIPGNIFWIPALFQLLITVNFIRSFLKILDVITKKIGILGKYSQCLELIENTGFTSNRLSELKNKLTNNGTQKPGKVVNNLYQIMNLMDSGLNTLLTFFTNGLFTVNLHMLIAVEKWKNHYRHLIPQWFEILGEIDALSSLGNFAYNNPDFIYPEINEKEFTFSAENMGHPLIDKSVCVKNNFTITSWKNISIITGANMSGKSTLLRTIGTNYILAMVGAPVYAEKFIFTPVELHTSMRTNDNLSKRESYFYAELKRLKEIIDDLEKGTSKLILLDEILKGTNSVDKRNGSMALITQLTRYKMAAIVATHDQVLGELKNEFPDNISNQCFEISIVDDAMQIDYKLRDGICRNLNATYLMKNMGIIFPDKKGEE